MDNFELVFGIGTILIVLALLALVAWQNRQSGKLLSALTEAVKGVSDNTQIVDLIEKMATKVVPVELVQQYDKGADFLKTFTPDDIDKLIDALSQLVHRSTDGKPNVVEGGNIIDGAAA